MGAILSCCGLNQRADDRGYRNDNSERTPLLLDPTSILQQPRPEPTPEDQERDQATLDRIVNRTSENLINIQSTFDRRKNGRSMDTAEKSAHFKYLIERLQDKQSPLSVASTSPGTADVDQAGSLAEPDAIVQLNEPLTDHDRALLDTTTKLFSEAVKDLMVVKPVGDVFVKLSWER